MTAALRIAPQTLAALRKRAGLAPRYIVDCHPKQRAFIEDKSKRKCAQTSRRAGKSHGIGCWLLEGAERHPGVKSCYIALTRGKAKSLLWDDCLAPINRKYKLGLQLKQDQGLLYIVHPNGYRIWLVGMDNAAEAEKIRGEKLYRVVIDEAQAFGSYLEQMIEEAIIPTLVDYNGELALTGTPSPMCVGYFWAATTGGDPNIAKWPTHRWTVLDNPYIQGGAWLDEEKTRNGWDDTHPRYRREFLGEWTEDIGSLVYPLSAGNAWQPDSELPFGLPPGEYSYGLGVDLGFSLHSTAFTLVAMRRGTGQIYVLRSYTRSKLIPTALAAHVQGVREQVKKEVAQQAPGEPPAGLRVVVDEGALGKGYAEQMRAMGVACEPAQKNEKRAYQEVVRGLILTGSAPEKDEHGNYLGGAGLLVHFAQCRELVEECRKLQFDDETGFEDERYVRHCCFIAGTLVQTQHGEQPIESLRVGDLVQTRKGLRRVSAAACTGARPIWLLRTQQGRAIYATADHPVWSENRFKRLDTLVYGDSLVAWRGVSKSCSKASNIICGQIHRGASCASTTVLASAIEHGGYIERFGLTRTAQSRTAGMCTMLTAIRSTTRSIISKRNRRARTAASICSRIMRKSQRNIVQRSSALKQQRLHGTAHLRAALGTAKTQNARGKMLAVLTMCAAFAVCNSALAQPGQQSAQMRATQKRDADLASTIHPALANTVVKSGCSISTASNAFARDSAVSCTATGVEALVYNITVEGEHEYFANGLLVSNCDSLLYIVRAMFPTYAPQENAPAPGSAAALKAEMAKQREKMIKKQQAQRRKI